MSEQKASYKQIAAELSVIRQRAAYGLLARDPEQIGQSLADVARLCDVVERLQDGIDVGRVLRNLVCGIAKLNDAPASAGTHLDSAICELANATDWRPLDEELMRIIDDAQKHMALLRGVT